MQAYCGFQLPYNYKGDRYAIATGNWGCGAFGGDKLLKGKNIIMYNSFGFFYYFLWHII